MSGFQTNYVNVDSLYAAVGGLGGGDFSNQISEIAGVGTNSGSGGDRGNEKERARLNNGTGGFSGNSNGRWGRESEDSSPLCPSITYKKRLLGFVVMVAFGFLFGIFTWVTAFQKSIGACAVIYTFSWLFAAGSTLFLCGPLRQLKNLRGISRIVSFALFFIMVILTYVLALAVKVAWASIITILVQYIVLAWYALSYIPFARDGLRSCFGC